MRRNHAQEDPIEGFDTNDLPAMGPDGLAVGDQRPPADPPPRLCEQGPCIHYHRFAIQLDAEAGLREADGSAAKQPFHVRTHHYCYPTSGVETELGALPVLECNRWTPMGEAGERGVMERARANFLASSAGQEYTRKLEEWKAARQAERDASDDLATWIAMNMRDGGELEIRVTGESGAVAEGRPDADTARAFVTAEYLRTNFGIGRYELTVHNPGAEPISMQLEVK